MPIPTIRWNVDADGDWGTAADWDLGRVPDAADDVVINTADRHTVTYGAGADTVHTLTVRNDDFGVSGGSLTITAGARFAHRLAVSGGILAFDGRTTVASVALGGGATLRDFGRLDQGGKMTIGDAGAAVATLAIGAGGVYALDNGSDIARGGSGASRIRNHGLLIKSGDFGLSRIAVKTVDDGVIRVAGGTLQFTRAIKGGGGLTIDSGATLEVGRAAPGLAMNFNGPSGLLVLSNFYAFAATIGQFALGDRIDLLGVVATDAHLGFNDRLEIDKGSLIVGFLQLAGGYSNVTFRVANDGNGGTNITLLPRAALDIPPSSSPLRHDRPAAPVPGHRFIAATAGFGAGGGMGSAWVGTHPETFRLVLSAPGTHFA